MERQTKYHFVNLRAIHSFFLFLSLNCNDRYLHLLSIHDWQLIKKKIMTISTLMHYKGASLNFEGKKFKFNVDTYCLLLLDLSQIPYNRKAASSFIGPSGEDVRKGGSAYSTWCHLWGQTDLATKTPELWPFSWKQIRYLQQQTSIQSHL